jgi:hypothetical protein
MTIFQVEEWMLKHVQHDANLVIHLPNPGIFLDVIDDSLFRHVNDVSGEIAHEGVIGRR